MNKRDIRGSAIAIALYFTAYGAHKLGGWAAIIVLAVIAGLAAVTINDLLPHSDK